MRNKRAQILDDVEIMEESLMGGAKHSHRAGVAAEAVRVALPVVIPDITELVLEDAVPVANKEGPVLLNWSRGDLQVSVLVVYSETDDLINCFPYSDTNPEGKWWIYETGFKFAKDGTLEMVPVHPLVEYGDPTQEFMAHIESLAIIVASFLARMADGSIYLEEGDEDLSRLNKKREKKGKTSLEQDWIVKYGKQNGKVDSL